MYNSIKKKPYFPQTSNAPNVIRKTCNKAVSDLNSLNPGVALLLPGSGPRIADYKGVYSRLRTHTQVTAPRNTLILFTTFLDTVVQWHNPVTTTSKIRIQQQAQFLVNSKTSLKKKKSNHF